MTISLDEILRLSVTERVQLVADIWDSIASTPDDLQMTEAQRRELDRRLDDLERHRPELATWDEVRARLERKG